LPRRFVERTIRSWTHFLAVRREFGFGWLFRGQPADRPLKTTLERACEAAGLRLLAAIDIEEQLIRDFRRRYNGGDAPVVQSDKLYCLALMQHHGAPTRLLDFTYSPFVAAYFAFEDDEDASAIWCVNGDWALSKCQEVEPRVVRRNIDAERNDATFDAVYRKAKRAFTFPDNPLLLNTRLITQQGVFLVPGDLSRSFMSNLKGLDGWNKGDHVVKLRFRLTPRFKRTALGELHAMNITRASLFPGLDGFAQSLKHRVWFYRQLAHLRVGRRPPNIALHPTAVAGRG
jgi:hypothetical protein